MCLRIIGAGAVRGHVPVPPAARGWKEPRNDQSQPYDAGNPAAGKDYTPVGRSDNGSHPLVRTPPRCWALVVPDRRTVDHPLTRPGNPDASLSAFWRGSGAGARRASDAPGGSAGSDLRQREGRYGVPLQRNRQDSRYCPDRTGGRSPPDGGSGRSGTGVQCSPSAQKADEDLIVGQKRETVNRPCFARHLGVRYRGDVQNRDPVSHLSQRLPLSTPLPTFCHPPWIRDLSCKITRPGILRHLCAGFGSHLQRCSRGSRETRIISTGHWGSRLFW